MYNTHQLSAGTETVQEIAPQNATANINSTGVDMQGWDGVMFVLSAGVFGANAALNAFAQESVNANFSGPTNINYANGTIASINIPNANANVVGILDIQRPDKRYVQLVAVPVTANGVFVSATSTRYRHTGILPPTHSAYTTVFVQVS